MELPPHERRPRVIVRGWLALASTSLSLLVGDVIQRLVIAPCVKLRPSKRGTILTKWIKIMAWVVTRPVALLAGCRIPRPQEIVPSEPGVLILMNHQSLFDIPLVIQTVADGYPRIVTRARYKQRYIPVISQMVRLYQYPVVDPSANRDAIAAALEELETVARATELPLAVFPEGTRTKDGNIGRFKIAGLARILSARPWTVYVYVADGFWRAARFKDFVRHMSEIDGRIEHLATLEWTDPQADPKPFLDEVRQTMVEGLRAMRGEGAVA